MLDLEQLQILAQLVDNAEVIIEKLEKAYEKNNAEEFKEAKKVLLNIQDKISSTPK